MADDRDRKNPEEKKPEQNEEIGRAPDEDVNVAGDEDDEFDDDDEDADEDEGEGEDVEDVDEGR